MSSIDVNEDWQAESDLRTLRESDEIRSDNERMARLKSRAAEQVKELQADSRTKESDLEKGFTSLGRMKL